MIQAHSIGEKWRPVRTKDANLDGSGGVFTAFLRLIYISGRVEQKGKLLCL